MNTQELIVPDHFLRSTRDSGYKSTASALAELIDNSIDAGASEIHVQLYKLKGEIQLSVVDDGSGMTENELAKALLFGGSSKYNSRMGIGRYGFGLSNASLSQARRVEVLTWQKKGQLRGRYLDLDTALVKPLAILSPQNEAVLDVAKLFVSGTVVTWRSCDRLSHKKISTLVKHLSYFLGRYFRVFLYAGLELKINGENISAFDPLFIGAGANMNGAREYGPKLSYRIRIPGLKNKTSRIDIRFVELPVLDWANMSNEEKRAYGITQNAGMSIMRSGREIDFGWFFMGSKRKENYDAWWRAELRFAPELDELFGVTHTKQLIKPGRYIKDIITPDVEGIARELNTRAKNSFIMLKEQSIGARTKKIAERLDHLISPPSIETKKPSKERIIKGVLRKSIIGGLSYTLLAAELNKRDFYEATFNKESILITLNTAHPFFEKIYKKSLAEEDNQFAKQLEILIFAAARAESLASGIEAHKMSLEFKNNWSKILATFI